MRMINKGRTAEVFDFGNNKVLKLFHNDFPNHAVEEEAKIMNVIGDYKLIVPKYFGKVEKDDRTGLVYEYIKGSSMLSAIVSNPLASVSLIKQMAEVQLLIHKNKVDGIPEQKERLEYCINNCCGLSHNTKKIIINKLQRLKNDSRLCHGDFHPDNIILSSSGNPIVIDWMTASSGNPVGDVARTRIILKHSEVPSHLPIGSRIISNLLKHILCKIYTRHYIKLTGITKSDIYQWELPIAAGRLYEGVTAKEKVSLLKYINKSLRNGNFK